MKRNCPICGSENIDVTKTKQLSSKILFDGTSVFFETTVYKCSVCEEEFYDENTDKDFEQAKEQKIHENSLAYMNSIKENFKSVSFIERVFGIPQRTIGRWKGGTITSIAYAFLCLIGRLPWLVEIVDSKFDKNVVAKVLAREAELAVREIAKDNNYEMSKNLVVSPGKNQIVFKFELNNENGFESIASSENPSMEEEMTYYSLPFAEAKRA